MNAVVSASVTAAAARRGPSPDRRVGPGRGTRHRGPRRQPPANRCAGARIDDVILLADAGRPERRLAHGQPGQHARRRARVAQRQRPAGAAGRRLQREHRAESSVNQRLLQAPTPRAAPPPDRPRSPCRYRRGRPELRSSSRGRRSRRRRSRATAAPCRSRRRTRRPSARTCGARSPGTPASTR